MDRGNLAGVVFADLVLKLLEISGAVSGQSIAAIHESMDENAIHAILLSHLQQRIKMCLLGVDTTVGNQAKQMQTATPGAGMLHRAEQRRIGEEFAVLDHVIDAGDIHVHDSPRANVEVPDFAVAHLAIGQTNVFAAGVNERVGIFAEQAVVGRLAGDGDGVCFCVWAVAPAIEDDQDERFGSHVALSFQLSGLRSQERSRGSVQISTDPGAVMRSATGLVWERVSSFAAVSSPSPRYAAWPRPCASGCRDTWPAFLHS